MNNKKQRNRLFTMLLLVMAILMPYEGAWAATNVTTSRPAQGDGSSSNPFQISNAKELAWFRDWVNGTYTVSGSESATTHLNACAKLTADIDLKDFCYAADASQNLEELSWVPIGKNIERNYKGTFDGNNKTITNLYINATQKFMGLFGCTDQSTIKNLTFEYANVTNTQDIIGILVGYANTSTLQNIKISETCQIRGNYTGGIAGILDGNAYNCVNYATVQGKEKVGGLFGSYQKTGNSITACANYGNVTATSQRVGGLVGDFSGGTIQDCANYGNVKGANSVAGLAGYVHNGKIQNVFSYGNISATESTHDIGMAFGYSKYGDTEGMVAYYSGAKLTANSQEITVKAFGSGNLSEDNATGFTETQLKSGVVAYLLQQNASSEAKWGQNLANNGDSYPVIGSEHQVYADNLTLNCKTYKVVKGSLTNNPTSSAIRYQHGQTINHHAATNATCTEAATKEYWQCQDCQRIYSDSQLTKELTDVTDAEHPALGHTNNEDGYCDRCKHYVAVKPSEQNGVYLIAKPCHLAWFRDYVNGTIVDEGEVAGTTHSSASAMLTADIDLKNYCHAAEDGKELLSWLPIGNSYDRWKGNMDGQGHTISHLYIKTAQIYVGLFGYTEDATIQNLTFDYAKVENVSTCTGILAGYAFAYSNSPAHIKGIKTTKNCTVIGQGRTGGIVGDAQINLENCENHSSVKGTSDVGGIAGSSTYKNIKCCTNYGTVENNNSSIGGIIGSADRPSIEDCANYGKITSTGWLVGGIAGQTLINCSIQNVFSYGDVTNTNDNPGIIIGRVHGTLTAKGIVTYNKEALLNNSSENIKIVGSGSLTFEDGKVEADVVKAFTKQQIKSGEVAWLLNGSTSTPAEGSILVWYQKLGENGDEYPVLTPSNGNTVYNNYYTCGDKQVNIFSNTEANAHEKYDKHVKDTETLLTNGLYSSTCQRCENNFLYIKDFCGIDGNDLELTANTDGSYTTFKPVDINDDAPYNSPVDFTAPTLNYTRDYLGADQWQAVYVPFETQATDWTGNGITVASINNFHEYEKEDGSGYETVLEVKKATSGEFEANTPYLLRTNDSGSKTITINNAKLHKAESKTHYCMSMTRKYDFTGIYTPQSGLGQDGVSVAVYALNKKGCIAPLNPSTEVGAQRWYLTVSNRNGSNMSQASKSRSINIDEVGEGSTTAIEGIQVITNNEADKTSLNGIYDLQGRKLCKEPTHGIYIKNGKKYVKFNKLGI
ncbi:hypothetical protein [Segatella copri]|uniref:Uncharacterized protein n=1 Tax=Segatella copri TaxID=165179 RepID=A0AAW5I2N3_9BACT|nr:hypothetical protein [Segatella copri]MBM0155050.1 hypothetical protein [Segatella copri]MCF0067409.1 hypothetical protein [Segatella copri]MCP9457074.1 hypothetical protein [Segatella copri]MCP9501601.1 hypothetical protein [Segatella copri]MCP9504381.1 hypothetical protein [Segatella copri]